MNIAKYLEEARKPAPKKPPAEKKLSPFLMDFIRHTMEANKGKVLHSLGKVEWDSYARDYAEDYPGDPHGLAARLEEVFWGEQDLRDTMIRDLLASPGVEGRMISALDALVGHHAQIEDDNFGLYAFDGDLHLDFEATGAQIDPENPDEGANRPPEVAQNLHRKIPDLNVSNDYAKSWMGSQHFTWKCHGKWPLPTRDLLAPYEAAIKELTMAAAKKALHQ